MSYQKNNGGNLKFLVVSGANSSMQELQKLTSPTLKKYCNYHGYDCNLAEITQTERPAPWYKIQLIQQGFDQGYDFVLWIDADAIIVNPYPLTKWTEENKDFYFACNWAAMNSGVMLLRNTQINQDFLNLVWDQTQFIDDTWWEQRAIIHLMENGVYPYQLIKEIPSEIFNTDQYWGGCFVYHLSGVANSDRIRMFRKVLHKG